MNNMFCLIGRLNDIKENGEVTIIVSRNHKDDNGIYKFDIISIQTIGLIKDTTIQHCRKGDIIGVKGTIESGNKLVADKLTFLSSYKEDKEMETIED